MTDGTSRVDPEAMAVAYDAIRDGEFNGLPPKELADAFMKAAVNLTNDGYDTLGSQFDPGTWESIRTGERVDQFDVCPVCDWQHSYEVIDPKDGERMVFCSRTGVVR